MASGLHAKFRYQISSYVDAGILHLLSLGSRIIFELEIIGSLINILVALPRPSPLISLDSKHPLSCTFKIIWRLIHFNENLFACLCLGSK